MARRQLKRGSTCFAKKRAIALWLPSAAIQCGKGAQSGNPEVDGIEEDCGTANTRLSSILHERKGPYRTASKRHDLHQFSLLAPWKDLCSATMAANKSSAL